MNRYSRVFHHISLDDVKRNRLKAKDNRKSFLESVRKAREFLRDLNSPYYSDWRNSSLKEDMTTSSVFFTTFPGTGEANLETIAANNADAYTDAGGEDALNGVTIRANGTGTGTDGGFNVGQSYLAFDGDVTSRHAILDPIDSSKFDTLVLSAIVGNDTNGGEDPDVAGEELRLYYLEPGGSSFKSISVNPDGDQALSANADVIIDLGAGNGSLQNFSISLPSYARGEGFTYMLFQLSNSGDGFDHYGITNVKYQRRNSISLLVSLDSPEAVSFISDGSGGMTAAEKKKRLEDMLAASDEYMETMFPTNQEAMKRAEENLKRNIDISLDPNTFKFPEYGTPEYNQMFNPYMDANSDVQQIKNSLESKGLSLDNLDKDFNSQRGLFQSLGQEGTLILLNNPDTQEQALTAMGIDPGLVTNYTPDSWEKITKITNLRPGGTPATGWDGRFYEYDDPQLEASQVIPLETYLQVKGTDNYIGVERPDRAQPGFRYVMEKPYSFSQESEARPVYTSVRNKDMEDRSREVQRRMVVSGGDYDLGLNYYYNRYEKGYSGISGSAKSLHSLRTLMDVVIGRLKYISDYQPESAYGWYQENAKRNAVHEEMLDPKTEYDPLWMFYTREAKGALELAKGLSSGRDLDSPVSYYTNNADSPETKAMKEQAHKQKNDSTYFFIQKYLNNLKGITDATVFEQDEWYINDPNTLEVRTTHPYANMVSQQQPQPPKPDDSYMNIKVGDEQIIKQGGDTIVDTLKGIDNRQMSVIEKEMDRIKNMPPDVRGELTRLLSIAGTTEYTPTSPKTKKEIEDYWASLPPEKLSEIEGRTQASGVDAIGLAVAALAGLALGATGAGAALTSALSSGISKIKNLTKAKPKPSNVRYGSGSSKPTPKPKDVKYDPKKPGGGQEYQQAARDWQRQNPGKYNPYRSDAANRLMKDQGVGTKPNPNPNFRKPVFNSYEPQGDSLIDNYEPKAKHNEKITKHPKIKSPKDFFNRADIKPVYPDTPPPEMINGRHPDLVDGQKVSDRYNRLDPISAKSMPSTGNPHIDKKVRAAAKKPK